MNAIQQTIAASGAISVLEPFVSSGQFRVIGMMLRGEERQHIINKIAELASTITNMPKTFEQEGKGDDAVVHLHYFHGGADWYITEKDAGDGSSDLWQHQAFGMADLGDGPELGYISIEELRQHGIELDLYWTPKTIGEIKKAKG